MITSGTVITTDPSITTNGVTDFGKIYRDPVNDGAFSLWAFGSTSAFDTALGIDDNFFADPNHLPIAAFKFQSLSLTGNPTIDTSNGGVTKLALIGVNGITSGPPGGILTFTGLDLLVLATVDGSINLTSDVSFQNLSVLAMYARGAGSDLILDSPISNIGTLKLGAEGSIQLTNPGTMNVGQFDATAGDNLTLQIGGSLLLNGKVRLNTLVLPGTTVASGANLTLNITGDYTNSSTGDFSAFQLTNQGTINQNGNISLGVNGNLNCANGVLIQVNNELDSGVSATHGGTIGGDSSISVNANTVSTEGFLVSLLNENDQGGTGTAGGHIGGAASIAINVNGALTANANNPNVGVEPGAFDLFIENYGFGDGSPGGFIGFNASVSIAAASISTAADFAVGIDNDDGGTIGGAARLSVTAGSMSVDEFSAQINNGNFTGGNGSVGGQIAGAASITFNVTGALNVAGGTDNDGDEPSTMSFQINNSGFGDGSPAGSIGSDASIDVTAGSISDNGRLLRLAIFNGGGGMIGGNASITVAANSISAAGPGPTGTGENLNLLIDNSVAGNIDGNATISLNAGSVSATGSVNVSVFNNGGSGTGGGTISGNAAISLGVGGSLTTANGKALNLFIGNSDGGHIGGDASIFASIGGNVNTTDLNIGIQDYNSGTIIGGGDLTLTVNGSLTVAENTHPLFLFVNTFNGGFIGNGGNIFASVGGDLTSGNISSGIQNQDGGTINTGGNFNLTVGGNLTTAQTADLNLGVNNFNGGSIGTGGNLVASVGGDISTRNIFVGLNNSNSGMINNGGNVNLTVNGNLTTAPGGSLNLYVVNTGQGHIGTGGNIIASIGQLVNTDNINIGVTNYDGGVITTGGTITFDVAGDVSTTGSAFLGIFNNNDGSGNGGGTIGGDAMLNVNVANISSGPDLNSNALVAQIDNRGGSIGGDAIINFAASGNVDAQGNAFLQILNFNDGGNGPGTIGGDVTLNISAASISTAGFFYGAIDNSIGGTIGGSANLNFNLTGDLTTQGDANFQILNNDGGQIGNSANISVATGGDLTANSIFAFVNNRNGGAIGSAANMSFNIGGALTTQGDAVFVISNRNDGSGGGTIGSNALVSLNAESVSVGGFFDAVISTNGGGHIAGDAINTVNVTGDLTAQQGILVDIEDTIFGGTGNFTGGHIGGNAIVTLSAQNITTPSTNSGIPGTDLMAIEASIYPNTGGTVGGDAIVDVSASQDISAPGSVLFWVANGNYQNLGPGMIGGNAEVNVSASHISTGDFFDQILNYGGASIGGHAAINLTANTLSVGGNLDSRIDNFSGGSIGGSAGLNFDLTGGLTTQGDATFQILNNDGGHIGGNANILVTTGSGGDLTANSILAFVNNHNVGTIGSGANITFDIGGALTTTGDASFAISNFNDGTGGGTIGSLATVDLNAASISVGGFFETFISAIGGGTIGLDATINLGASTVSIGGPLSIFISDNGGGSIGGSAIINFGASGDITTVGDALFVIDNSVGAGSIAGTIGSDATITVNANNISTGGTFDAEIDNSIGSGRLGIVGGTIGGDATINVAATNITANSLLAQIDNTGGSIGANTEGGATINMNVSGTATVTNDATVAIYGSDGAVGGAGININGGNYNVGGTFLSYIDGNGTMTFNNASLHADVLKAGVFGTNGALNISGGMLSADSTLKLYAPGSNGQLNFMSNVTLGGNSLKILAANSITISNNVVVTISIGGPIADVYTNHANYTGFGGNGTTTGTFAGAGAHNPQPLSSAPPFGPASPVKLTIRGNILTETGVLPQSRPARTPAAGGNITSRTRIPPPSPSNVLTGGKIADVRRASNVINVRSSDELLSLLDGADPGHGGKITIPPSKNASNSKNSNRTDPAARLNAGSRANVDRRAMDMRTASSAVMRRSPQ